MPSERISLKERGRQILGLNRRDHDDRALLRLSGKTATPPAPGQGAGDEKQTRLAKTVPGLYLRESDPNAEGRIEALLDAEAAAATGEDDLASGGDKPTSSDTVGPLPAVEWIAPISPHPVSAARNRPDGAGRAGTRGQGKTTGHVPALERGVPAGGRRSPGELIAGKVASRRATTERATTTITWSVSLTPEEEAAMLARADIQQHLADLDRAIRSQYDRILTERVSGHKEITDWCHSLLAEARTIVMYRRLGELARAEWDLEQVRVRLDRAEASVREAHWPLVIILWAAAWLAGYVILILRPTVALPELGTASAGDAPVLSWMLLQALAFGGIGSVAGVFGSLAGQVRDRCFDRRSVPFYLAKPFVGMALGSAVYLVFVAVATVVGALASVDVLQGAPGTPANMLYSAPMLLVALTAGLKENAVVGILNRLVKLRTKNPRPADTPEA